MQTYQMEPGWMSKCKGVGNLVGLKGHKIYLLIDFNKTGYELQNT